MTASLLKQMLVTKFALGRTFVGYLEGRAMRLKSNYLNRGVIGGAILGHTSGCDI